VDAASRTLLTEVDAVNADGTLLPGMYAEVHFRFEQSAPPILIPSTAMIFRAGAPQAAVLTADSTVHFHDLRIGRDLGAVVEVDSGLGDGDFIVVEPSDDLRDGQHVHAEAEGGAPGGAGWAGRPEASEPRPDSAVRKARGAPRLPPGGDRP
jgi:membrane fusion protein, multidrug efflux system